MPNNNYYIYTCIQHNYINIIELVLNIILKKHACKINTFQLLRLGSKMETTTKFEPRTSYF